MNGWEKCEQLKRIRKLVADANNIPYEIEECLHLEDCIGTCPKCDAEVEYINQALNYRAKSGRKIVVDGLFDNMFQEDIIKPSRVVPQKDEEMLMGITISPEEEELSVRSYNALKRRGQSNFEDSSHGGIALEEAIDGGIDLFEDYVDTSTESSDGGHGGIDTLSDIVDDLPFN